MSIRVLIVDDDDQIRRALSTALSRSGFTVSAVDDGPAAIALLDEPLDCLVVDFNLRTTTGDEVVRAFRRRHGGRLFCLVLSGEDDPAAREACLRAGADDLMLKPTSPRTLRERLTEAVAVHLTAA